MLGLIRKGVKAIATGNTQRSLGMQSPHLAGGVVRLGRFAYVASGVWISGVWYAAYVNQRTQPGSGPTLLLPGKPIISSPDRPTNAPKFAANIFNALTGNTGATGSDGGPIGDIAGAVGSAVSAVGGKAFSNGQTAYPGPIGRTDQGVDFGGTGPVRALGNGRVIYAGLWHGWPGTDGIVYSTPRGNVYIMEHFQRAVNPATGKPYQVGDTVTQGQVLGVALSGYPNLESGLADSTGTRPLTPYNGSADGTPMPGGLAFRKLLGY